MIVNQEIIQHTVIVKGQLNGIDEFNLEQNNDIDEENDIEIDTGDEY